MYHHSQVGNDYGSDSEKIGATAYASSTIWLIAVKFIGPHDWDVRAVVITDSAVRVGNVQ